MMHAVLPSVAIKPIARLVRKVAWLSVGVLFLALCLQATADARSIATLYLAGDSTLAEKLATRRPETGWGEALQEHFDAEKMRISNQAKNGRSTRTFIEENRWSAIIEQLKAGDYVMIEFGHNDSSEDKPDRYTPPPVYRQNLVGFIADVRAKHATPILMTPVVRRNFDAQGQLQSAHGVYPQIVRDVAKQFDVTMLDMYERSAELLRKLGPEKSKDLFLILQPGESTNYPQGLTDNTHFKPRGAEEMARLAEIEIKRVDKRLAFYLKRSRSK